MRSFFLVIAGREELLSDPDVKTADAVCIDLEDTLQDKATGRRLAMEFMAGFEHAHRSIRINGLGTWEALEDLQMIAAMAKRPDSLTVPRVEDPAELRILAEMLPGMPLSPIVESPKALEAAFDIAAAPQVHGLKLGGKDLSLATKAARSWNSLAYARGRIVQAAAAHGLAVYDEPFTRDHDPARLESDAREIRALGFTGKTVVAPSQIAAINAAFREE